MLRSALPVARITHAPRRFLNLHEHQAKQLMADFRVRTQPFRLVTDVASVPDALRELHAPQVVVKAQVLAGGRGKGRFLESGLQGGVHVLSRTCIDEITGLVRGMLHCRLVTHQTPPDGIPVEAVMLAEAKDLLLETYVAFALDREAGGVVLIASPCGGVDIEAVPPARIRTFRITDAARATTFHDAARFLFPATTNSAADARVHAQACEQLERLYHMLVTTDATLVEVNPFGLTPQGDIFCFDAKLQFDENAAFRQHALFAAHRSNSHGSPLEAEAQAAGLSYIPMHGSIGCMVNGAGLAMATMDLISLHGGTPANFLDVGGGAQADQIAVALAILLKDPQVRCVLVNIFGGIMRGDVIAQVIVNAVRQIGKDPASPLSLKPIVVRLAGTMAVDGLRLLKDQLPNLEMVVCEDAEEAAMAAVRLGSYLQDVAVASK